MKAGLLLFFCFGISVTRLLLERIKDSAVIQEEPALGRVCLRHTNVTLSTCCLLAPMVPAIFHFFFFFFSFLGPSIRGREGRRHGVRFLHPQKGSPILQIQIRFPSVSPLLLARVCTSATHIGLSGYRCVAAGVRQKDHGLGMVQRCYVPGVTFPLESIAGAARSVKAPVSSNQSAGESGVGGEQLVV